jgi:hypothetical protein
VTVVAESDLPWVPGAVRQVLLADTAFATACHHRLATTRAFSDVGLPFGLLRVVVGSLQPLGGGGYKVDVQLDAFCLGAGYADEEPDPIVWRIANRGVRVLQQTKNQRYQTMHWSVSRIPFAGPLDPDDSRGDDTVLYRAAARAELAIHNI